MSLVNQWITSRAQATDFLLKHSSSSAVMPSEQAQGQLSSSAAIQLISQEDSLWAQLTEAMTWGKSGSMKPNCGLTQGDRSLWHILTLRLFLSTIFYLLKSEADSECDPIRKFEVLYLLPYNCIYSHLIIHNQIPKAYPLTLSSLIQTFPPHRLGTSHLICKLCLQIKFFQFLQAMRKKNHFSPTPHDASFVQPPVTIPQSLSLQIANELASIRSFTQQQPQPYRYKISKPQPRSLDEVYLRDQVRQRGGTQVQRLNETINSLVGMRKKKEKLGGIQQNSIIEESEEPEQSLPNIGGTLYKKDSSKLMDEIKRVEHKIKALRNERQDVNSQRKQYDIIRPFIEIHNQSMLYMQMMMAGSQKQGNCHHHCPQTHHPHSQNCYPPNYHQPITHQQHPHMNSKQAVQRAYRGGKEKPKSHGKKYNFAKIRKFRIAVIAVYFHLLLPRYASRFTIKRFKSHCEKYLSSECGRLRRQIEQEMRERVLKWNMVKISQLVGKSRAEKEVKRVKQTKTAKLIITEQYNGNDNYEFYLGDVELFLFEFLKRMKQVVLQENELQNILRYAADGNLPLSFPIDHYHLLDQIYSLSAHTRRLYWLNNRKVAKALILSCIFVKLITYALFFPIKQTEEWKVKMLKINGMKKEQMIEAEMAAVQMHLSGILLHKYSMQLIEEVMLEENSNCLQISQESWPLPEPALCFQGSGDVEQALGQASSKKIKPKVNKNFKKKEELSLQGYKQYKLYDFSYIKNLSQFEHLLEEINKASHYEENVKQTIVEIVDAIYEKQLAYRRQNYKKLKEELLLQEKRMLNSKVSYSELSMPKRNVGERKLIKEAIELVRLNRERQEEGTEEEEAVQEDQDEEEG